MRFSAGVIQQRLSSFHSCEMNTKDKKTYLTRKYPPPKGVLDFSFTMLFEIKWQVSFTRTVIFVFFFIPAIAVQRKPLDKHREKF